MAFTIATKNGEKTFANKELVNISSKEGGRGVVTDVLRHILLESGEWNDAYKEVLERFSKGNVVAYGYESLMSLYLSNAMYLSSWKNKPINLYEIGSKEELEFENEFEEEMKKRI